MKSRTEKDKAIKLRKKGFSLNEISKKLNKNKSTVAHWCKDIQLNNKQIERLRTKSIESGKKSGIKISETAKEKRLYLDNKYSNIGKKDLIRTNRKELFYLGLGLYWGEGYKKGNYEFGFTNSDPNIIRLFMKWVKEIYSVNQNDFILRVSINNLYRKSNSEIINYWSKVTKTSLDQFTKTSFIKTDLKRKYLTKNAYYGTLRIKVRNGSNLKRRVLGSIKNIPKTI